MTVLVYPLLTCSLARTHRGTSSTQSHMGGALVGWRAGMGVLLGVVAVYPASPCVLPVVTKACMADCRCWKMMKGAHMLELGIKKQVMPGHSCLESLQAPTICNLTKPT